MWAETEGIHVVLVRAGQARYVVSRPLGSVWKSRHGHRAAAGSAQRAAGPNGTHPAARPWPGRARVWTLDPCRGEARGGSLQETTWHAVGATVGRARLEWRRLGLAWQAEWEGMTPTAQGLVGTLQTEQFLGRAAHSGASEGPTLKQWLIPGSLNAHCQEGGFRKGVWTWPLETWASGLWQMKSLNCSLLFHHPFSSKLNKT